MVSAATHSASTQEPASIRTQIGTLTAPSRIPVCIVRIRRCAAVACARSGLSSPRALARNFDAALPVVVGHSRASVSDVAMAEATTPSTVLPAM